MNLRNQLLLLGFAIFLGAVILCAREASGHDEPRVGGIVREMAMTGDFLVPRLNGQAFSEYPPLGYWIPAFLMRSTGSANTILLCIPGVLFSLATLYLTFRMGRQLGGEALGLTAGFFLQAAFLFLDVERSIVVDGALLFFVTLSVMGLLEFSHGDAEGWRSGILFYVGMAGGFLTKGLVGIAIPSVVALGWFIAQRDGTTFGKLLRSPSILLFVLPIGLWAGALYVTGHVDVLQEVLNQSLARFGSASADHIHGSFFYLGPFTYNFFPGFFVFLALAWLRFGPSKWIEAFHFDRNSRFPFLWFCCIGAMLTLSLAKRVLYLAPLLPPFALLTAFAWEKWKARKPWKHAHEIAVVSVFMMVFAAAHFFLIVPAEKAKSLRPLFYLVKQNATGRELVLFGSSERIRGAAVLYLGKTSRLVKDASALQDALGDGASKLVLISRNNIGEWKPEDARAPLHLLEERTIMHERLQLYAVY